MDTLNYILSRFKLGNPGDYRMPIEIPNVGRDDLPGLFRELGFTVGAEIGTERGEYAEKLCQGNPALKLYCIDPWTAYREYREHVSQSKLDNFYLDTKERLAPYNCVLIRKFSTEAAKDFKKNELDFVYIDGNHILRQVIDDIDEWSKIVRPGGIIAGHDYLKRKDNGYHVHVVEAVGAWTQAYHINPWFVLGTKEIREGETRDRARSWMWVKE